MPVSETQSQPHLPVHQCYSSCSKERNAVELFTASKVAPILSFCSFQDVVVVFQFVGTVSAVGPLPLSSSLPKGLRSSRVIASIIVPIIDYVSLLRHILDTGLGISSET